MKHIIQSDSVKYLYTVNIHYNRVIQNFFNPMCNYSDVNQVSPLLQVLSVASYIH